MRNLSVVTVAPLLPLYPPYRLACPLCDEVRRTFHLFGTLNYITVDGHGNVPKVLALYFGARDGNFI
jgi:hypothetical protein